MHIVIGRALSAVPHRRPEEAWSPSQKKPVMPATAWTWGRPDPKRGTALSPFSRSQITFPRWPGRRPRSYRRGRDQPPTDTGRGRRSDSGKGSPEDSDYTVGGSANPGKRSIALSVQERGDSPCSRSVVTRGQRICRAERGRNRSMRTQLAVLLIGVVSPGVWGQDSAAEKIPAHARLLILKKQVVAAAESERLEAVQELAGIEDDEAIVVLAAKLRTDTDAVRTAAAHAIAQHRKPASVQAIGMAVDVNLQKEAVLHAFIEALSELDLCKCLTPLGALVWANKYALAGEALEAIGKIGCPEAVPFLADLLRRAETEEKKPDVFESDEGSDENRNKN